MTVNHQDKGQCLILWEFQVRAGMEARFEQIYGPEGDWVRCFRQSDNYLKTELVRDADHSRRYVTLDYWTSQSAYEDFRHRHAAQYKSIDQKCEEFTENEREIGRFELRTGNRKPTTE